MSMTASQALRIAFEDRETVHFIRTYFMRAEQRPQIITRRWRTKSPNGHTWHIAIIEKTPCFYDQRKKFLNVALLKVDSQKGQILQRQFYKNIFTGELRHIL
ncbi:MAG: hypothetical protein WCC06_01425 [Candidatus Aminicenantales bacterium]